MSLPEISRRCLACGASVRAGARFCPQCGHAVAAEEGEGAAEERRPVPEPGPREEVGPGWAAPAPLTRPGADAAEPDGPRELRRTREVETPPGGPAPKTRDLYATVRDDAPPPGASPRPTRETSSQAFAGGAPEGPHAAGEPARAEAVSEAGGAATRPRGPAARVRETVMPRVEKMRDEALVVLDETPDDSGLRFVLIAVFLFGLFLLFLLLSTTVLR